MAEPTSSGPTPKHPGDRLASYFENFFRGVIGIATFGASITFTRVASAPVAPAHNYGISPQRVQFLIAISWLFFVLALAFTSFAASALSLYRRQAVEAFGTTYVDTRRKVLWFATGVAALLFSLLVVAFITLSLVVVAYVGAVGWVAIFFTVSFALFGFGVMLWQSPLQWPLWVIAPRRREEDAFEEHMHLQGRGRGEQQQGPTMVTVPKTRASQPQRDQEQRAYGRSTSGDYGGGAGNWRSSGRREGEYDRYSRTSTVISDPYEPGRFGQDGMMVYDTGIREGLVMSRYPG